MHSCTISTRPKSECPKPEGSCVGCWFWVDDEPKVESIHITTYAEVVEQLNECKKQISELRRKVEVDAKRISDLEWKI